MRFKIHIQCNMCECGFDLSPIRFKDRSEFACPNCGKRMSESLSSQLRAGLAAFAQIPDTGGGFSFSVTGQTNSHEKTPEETLQQLQSKFQEEAASGSSSDWE